MTLLPLLLAACEPRIAVNEPLDDGTLSEDGGADDATDGGAEEEEEKEPDYSEYDGASLVVIQPLSGELYPLGDGVPFEAQVLDADGNVLPFDDIAWSTSVDSSWQGVGDDFTDDLDVGTHTITAVAQLPNGNTLGWTVGGVLVQHEDAGTYVGDLMVDFTIEYDGVPYTTTCIGAATMIVDAWGELAVGESACVTSLLGYDLDSTYDFEFEIEDADLAGEAILDLVWFESQFEATGTLGGGELTATWADNFLGFLEFEGELDLTRVSLDCELPE